MINIYELMISKKVDYIIREIMMGNRTEFDFNRQLVSIDNKGHLARCLHNTNYENYLHYANYLVEMGYLNVLHQDDKEGKKLRAWYETQLKHAHNHGYIQLYCILYARSEPMFKKYGEFQESEIKFFDIITDNYIENPHRAHCCSKAFGYMALSEYAAIICKLIAAWQSVPAEERAAQTRPEFKTWLENEKDFVEKLHLLKTPENEHWWKREKEQFKQAKEKMLEIIDQTLPLL